MAREGLRPKLRAAIERARHDHARTVVRGARLEAAGDETAVCIVVQPVNTSDDETLLSRQFFRRLLVGPESRSIVRRERRIARA